jgi:hypothetical protein
MRIVLAMAEAWERLAAQQDHGTDLREAFSADQASFKLQAYPLRMTAANIARDHRPLDDLVLQRGDRERALSPVRLGYVHSPVRQRPIRSPLDPIVQVLELALEVYLVVLPRQPIHARCSVLLEFEERLFEQVDADMVEERGEPLLLPFPRHFPYAFQRL